MSVEARFHALYVRGGADECWIWLGARSPLGYGRFRRDGRAQIASRVAYELAHGPIPDGRLVCHRCDNPPCVNPGHLFLGTDADNVRDMRRKGRAPRPWQLSVTHCPQGHEYTPENTYTHRNQRHCRACNRAHQSAYAKRARAALSLAKDRP
jgi:hypothetical protein